MVTKVDFSDKLSCVILRVLSVVTRWVVHEHFYKKMKCVDNCFYMHTKNNIF